jgi:hypothetical protein
VLLRRLVVLGTVALLLIGCSDGDGGGDVADRAERTAEPGGDDGDGGGEPRAGDLPDPCALVDDADLADLLGTDPGDGELAAPVPAQRKTCIYPSGLVLAVEVASNWQGSLAVIRGELGASALEPVLGVGEEAYWQADGAQLLALDDGHFVGVSVGSGTKDAARAIAEAMLAAG